MFAWWPHYCLLYFRANSVEMGGYALPLWLVSWIVGVYLGMVYMGTARRGRSASKTGARALLALTVLLPAEFLVRGAIAYASHH